MARILPLLLLLAAPALGSFLATVAWRWPRGLPLAFARSACPECGKTLTWRDLLPLVSWLLSAGRCRHCGGGISLLYPLTELAALAIAVTGLLVAPGWIGAVSVLLGWTLLLLALVDLRSYWLPDEITLPLALAGLAVAALLGRPLGEHLLGLALGFLFFAAVAFAWRRARGEEGLGLGDAKLFAAAGAWLGWQALPSVLLLAALVTLAAALLLRSRPGARLSRRLAFGPGLAFGFWSVWLLGPLALAWVR